MQEANFTTISCQFKETDLRSYTFKTVLKDLKPGDKVVAETSNGLSVVTVKAVETDHKLLDNVQYCWAFQKVDTDVLDLLTKSEHKIKRL